MNASPILRMALATRTVLGRRLASHAVYPQPLPGPPPRRPPAPDPPAPERLPLPLSGPGAARRAAGRRLLADLPVRRLPASAPRPLPRDRTPGPAPLAAGTGRTGTPPQLCPGRPPAAPAAAPPAAAGHRPDVGPLPRPALRLRRRGLPQQGPRRHQPLPRLRHRLLGPARPAFHPGPDPRGQRRTPRRGPQAPAQALRAAGHPPAYPLAGPGLLQRGRHPLPPGGTLPLPDAVAAARAQGRPPRRAQRQQRLPLPGQKRLGPLHPALRRRSGRDGVGVRQVPQLAWRAWAARPAAAGGRLLGLSAFGLGLGASSIPEPVRHRDELPAVAARTRPDEQPPPGGTAAAGGAGPGAAQRLGVAARRGAVHAAAGRARAAVGTAAAADHADLAAACGPATLRRLRPNNNRTSKRTRDWFLTPTLGFMGSTESMALPQMFCPSSRSRSISSLVKLSR